MKPAETDQDHVSELTLEKLRAEIRYDPKTGYFWRLVDRPRSPAGSRADSYRGDGYCRVSVGGRLYYAHRLAWFYMYGLWPEGQIDHRDLDKSNNRIRNLRIATPTQQRANTGLTAANRSGFKGVNRAPKCSKWQARIKIDGREKHLGLFDTPEAAAAAYAEAARQVHHEFARI